MDYSFLHKTSTNAICLVLFGGMLVLYFVGSLLQKRWKQRLGDEKDGNNGIFQNSLFALFGLIMAFSFGMSGSRYEYTRNAMIEESNAIATAILRTGLYSDSVKKDFTVYFKNYLEARINLYNHLSDTAQIRISKTRSNEAVQHLWKLAETQSKQPNMLIPSNQMIPALNNVFDLASKKDTLLRTTIPDLLVYMLLLLGLISSFSGGLLSGSGSLKENTIALLFMFLAALVIYVTIDLGRPLRGFIRADNGIDVLTPLLQMLK